MRIGSTSARIALPVLLALMGCSETGGSSNDDDGGYITNPDRICREMGERAVECRVSDSEGVGLEVADCIEEFDKLSGSAESKVVCLFNCWLDAPTCLEFDRLVTDSEDCENYCGL